MRCFVAIDLSQEIKQELARVVNELSKLGLLASLPRQEQLHVTLAFLGELSEQEIEQVKQKLSGIRFKKFSLQVRGTGFFPSDSFIRVFWAGVYSEQLLELQKIVSEALGVREERDFVPHIALARIKARNNIDGLIRLKNSLEEKDFGSMTVEKISLMKSTLTPKGALYEVLQEFSLE